MFSWYSFQIFPYYFIIIIIIIIIIVTNYEHNIILKHYGPSSDFIITDSYIWNVASAVTSFPVGMKENAQWNGR
jgi:hypothetical protein